MVFFIRNTRYIRIFLACASVVTLSHCGGGGSGEGSLPDSQLKEGDTSIAASASDSAIRISTDARFAGAVSSLTFRGKQYVDILDHGRQMQSASSFDYLGECYNPTEAGSRNDGVGLISSSHLLHISSGANWLETETKMAYWLSPGTDYLRTNSIYCGGRSDVTKAVNTTVTSEHVLKKKIEIGYAGFANAINYQAEFDVPEYRFAGQFEAATVYTPAAFAKRLVLDLTDGTVQETWWQGEQSMPVILATSDQQHAIGLYSANLPQYGVGYGTFGFSNTNKINCVFRETNIVPQAYRYDCIFAVGTVTEVADTILKLHRKTLSTPG